VLSPGAGALAQDDTELAEADTAWLNSIAREHPNVRLGDVDAAIKREC
jgi:hypothetical protein